jgi:nicotinamide mononucleotide adenylyltransferase
MNYIKSKILLLLLFSFFSNLSYAAEAGAQTPPSSPQREAKRPPKIFRLAGSCNCSASDPASSSHSSLEDKVPENTLVLLPGSFNPPHKRHYDMLRDAMKYANHGVIIIVIDSFAGTRHGVSPEKTETIWNAYISQIRKELLLQHEREVIIDVKFTREKDDPHYAAIQGSSIEDINKLNEYEESYIRIFAGADRKDYSHRMENVIRKNQRGNQSVIYNIIDRKDQDMVSSTYFVNAILSLKQSSQDQEQEKRNQCYNFFPDSLSEEIKSGLLNDLLEEPNLY